MYILGICGNFRVGQQDGAAVLIKDNEIIAGAEEERFNRIKHSPGELPEKAIKSCLKEANIKITDIDVIVFPGETYKAIVEKLHHYFEFHFKHKPKIELINHHLAHAASAYRVSGFDESLIITLDLSGDGISTLIGYGKGDDIKILKTFDKPNSFGIYYTIITQFLGFRMDNDEYKVMGLSSYGKDNMDFSWFLRYDGEGGYVLNRGCIKEANPDGSNPSRQENLYNQEFLDKAGPHRISDEEITLHHKNAATSAQRLLERVVIEMLRYWKEKTNAKRLCIAGGVGLNCVMAQKIWETGLFEEMYIPPCSCDAGLALGGALEIASRKGVFKKQKLKHPYLGPEFSNDEIEKELKKLKIKYREEKDIELFVAKELAKGKIIGWFQGGMEYGPRALGNRSILADPRDKEMKDKLNHLVKFREDFRPFAPSVLVERTSEFFVNPHSSPYMNITADVKEDKKNIIPAVTHVDGTARLHTVTQESNPKYYKLISEFGKITGVPVVLNTSFNVRGQPIVLNPQQAISTFFGTGMDILAIGDFVVEKNKQ